MSGTGTQVTARLSAESRVTAGERAKLTVDTSRIHLFDPKSGASLTAAAS